MELPGSYKPHPQGNLAGIISYCASLNLVYTWVDEHGVQGTHYRGVDCEPHDHHT